MTGPGGRSEGQPGPGGRSEGQPGPGGRSHAELSELMGAYALDAVDGDEAEAVDIHLHECPRCRAEVIDHRETAALLAHAGAPAPDGLWERIAGELEEAPPSRALTIGALGGGAREEGQEGGGPRRVFFTGRGPAGPGAAAARADRGRRRSVALRPVAALAGTAAVVIGLLGFELAHLQGEVSQVTTTTNRTTHLLPPAGLQQTIEAALLDPNRSVVEMTSGTGPPAAEAVLLPDGQGYLVRAHLPPLPVTRTYQLWALIGAQRVSLGLLGREPSEASFFVNPAGDVKQLLITPEPRHGSAVNTSPAVVWGPGPAALSA